MSRAHARVQLARLWQLITVLNAARSGSTVRQLEERLEVSRATVYRCLRTLEDAGVCLEARNVNGEKRYWLHGHELPAVAPSPLQLAALCLAREALGTFDGTAAARELDTLLARWATLPKVRLPWAKRRAGSGRADIVRLIDKAMTQHRQLELDYQGARDRAHVTRQVEPVALRAEGEQLYLFAFDPGRADYRTFKLARTASVKVLETRAGDHSGVDVDARFARSVKVWSSESQTQVVVRISPDKARFVGEYPLIAGQAVEREADGSAIVRASVNGTTEALRWVLSWGGGAEAIAPKALRDAVRDEVSEAAGRYAERRKLRAARQGVSPKARRKEGTVGA